MEGAITVDSDGTAEKLVTPDHVKWFIPLHGCLASAARVLVCTTQGINADSLVRCFLSTHFAVLTAYCRSSLHAAVVCLTMVHITSNCYPHQGAATPLWWFFLTLHLHAQECHLIQKLARALNR